MAFQRSRRCSSGKALEAFAFFSRRYSVRDVSRITTTHCPSPLIIIIMMTPLDYSRATQPQLSRKWARAAYGSRSPAPLARPRRHQQRGAGVSRGQGAREGGGGSRQRNCIVGAALHLCAQLGARRRRRGVGERRLRARAGRARALRLLRRLHPSRGRRCSRGHRVRAGLRHVLRRRLGLGAAASGVLVCTHSGAPRCRCASRLLWT